jgi:chorismate synthase
MHRLSENSAREDTSYRGIGKSLATVKARLSPSIQPPQGTVPAEAAGEVLAVDIGRSAESDGPRAAAVTAAAAVVVAAAAWFRSRGAFASARRAAAVRTH